MTDMSGTVCYAQDYLPFGESNGSSGACSTTHLFTGKERDSESGLDDFGARYYSSQYGQFMTADWSAIPVPVPYANLTNPQTLNLYAIVHDNPVSFADLDGHCPDSGSPGCGPGDKFDRQYGGGKNQTARQGSTAKRVIQRLKRVAQAHPKITKGVIVTLQVVTAVSGIFDEGASESLVPEEEAAGAALEGGTDAGEATQGVAEGKITGFTKHRINQAISREGVGVGDRSLLDAVKNPTEIIQQSGGRTMYIGKDATVVTNAEGKVITTWANGSAGTRIP